MVDPSLKSIQGGVEEGTKFVDWLVEVLRGKNWVKKLLLIDVIILAVFNPLFFPKILGFITAAPLPARYALYFWLVVGLVFVAAVVVAIRTKPKPPPRVHALDRRSPIKGLLSFTLNDAELFTRLQREDSLRDCLQSVTDNNFYFGILCGESGCGKSSFLQAGLWPRLLKLDHRCVYVKFSDLKPLDSIRAAFTEQLKIAKEIPEGEGFLALLKAATGEDSRPLIIIFDQFEQFFVHHQRELERAPFVEALGGWYRGRHQLPVRILVSLRGDFYDHMIELQKAMGYSLGPQQSHRLKRFEPEEATEIFRVIAETEGMAFDEGFVHELTEKELASNVDGLISPVDIQILAWMISGSRAGEERAFNRSAYQKFGGIEGLLEVFLSRVLEARETEARRQTAIKVLLALTDLERNVRAGTLTIEALKEKIAGTVSDAELKEVVGWLGRGDVRLITSVKRNNDEGYELAHERLIPALRKIAGKSLSQADQANQLLDRRVNEWLGNNRASRYLLTWRERRLVERQKPYLIWGPQKKHKESLLAQTSRRWRIRAAIAGVPPIIAICFLIWWNSEAGQLYQVKEDVVRYSQGSLTAIGRRDVIRGLMYAGRYAQSLQALERIENPYVKAEILWTVSQEAARAGNSRQASALLQQAQQSTDKLKHSDLDITSLRNIAEAAAKGGDPQRAWALLEQAQMKAEGTASKSKNVSQLMRVAETMFKTGYSQRAWVLLEREVQSVNSNSKVPDLIAIAKVAAMAGDQRAWALLQQAQQQAKPTAVEPKSVHLLSYPRDERIQIARAAAQTGDVQRSLQIVDTLSDSIDLLGIFNDLGEMVEKAGDYRQAPPLLEQVLQRAFRIKDAEIKDDVLSYLAAAAAETGDIQRALQIVENIGSLRVKSVALSRIAEAVAKTGDGQRALEMLEQVRPNVPRIEDYQTKAYLWSTMARIAAKNGDSQRAAVLLEQVLNDTKGSKESSEKASALIAISWAASKMGNLRMGHEVALLCDSDESKARALSRILIGWAERQGIAEEETEAEMFKRQYDDQYLRFDG